MAWWSQKECDQEGEHIFDQYLEMIFASAAFLRHQGSRRSSTVSWDHTHCQTHLLKPSSSTRKPHNSFQQMPQPRLFHTVPFFVLNSLPECFHSGRPCVLLGYQLKAHRGHGALKWRAQAVSKCLSDVFQPGLGCHWDRQTERFPLKLGCAALQVLNL